MKKNIKWIISSTIFIALVTLLSKVFGFLREVVLAYKLGASEMSDAFLLANTFPQLIYTSFVLALGVNFIPIYVSLTKQKALEFYKGVQFTLFIISILTLIFFLIFNKNIIQLLSPGSSQKFINITSSYANISMISVLFIGYVNLSISKLNTKSLQIVGASFPIITSVITVISLLLYGIIELEQSLWIISLAYFLQFLIIYFFIEKNKVNKLTGIFYKENISKIKRLYKQSIPTMMSTYIDQLLPLFERFLSSYLLVGSLTYLNYSHRLNGLLVGVIGSLITMIFFPSFSKKINESMEVKNLMISKGFVNIMIVCIPLTYFMNSNSYKIVESIFRNDLFDENDVFITASIFSIFIVGGFFNILRSFINTVFFSNMNTKDPFFASILIIISFVFGITIIHLNKGINLIDVVWIEIISFFIAFLFLLYKSIKKKIYRPHVSKIIFAIIILNSVSLGLNILFKNTTIVISIFNSEKMDIISVLLLKSIPYIIFILLFLLYEKKTNKTKLLEKRT